MDLKNLSNIIDVDLLVLEKHKSTFEMAFTHRSAVNEEAGETHNERLEFLGDAVLELATTEFLFKKYPEEAEGVLTNYRSALVKRENLAKVARKMNLGALLKLSAGEDRSGGREKDYLLANLVEAVIGALYVSVGFVKTKKFVKDQILVEIKSILEAGSHLEAKSLFQEFTQGVFGITPHYGVLNEQGKDHEKTFEIGAYLGEVLVGEGKGNSKKEAQSAAAQAALDNQARWENKFEKRA